MELLTRAPPAALLCRKAFVAALRERFADLDMEYSVGGQISFDVFPRVRALGARLARVESGRQGRHPGGSGGNQDGGALDGRRRSTAAPRRDVALSARCACAGLGQDVLPAVRAPAL